MMSHSLKWTFINRITSLATSGLTILFITKFFSPEIQGIHYTFLSVISIQMLLELGFNNVLVQFLSHESTSTQISLNKTTDGSQHAFQRTGEILRFALKWNLLVTIFSGLLALPCGYFFISHKLSSSVSIFYPFALLVSGSCLAMVNGFFRAVHDGHHQIAIGQKISFISSSLGSVIGWISMVQGANLFSAGIIVSSQSIIAFACFWKTFLPYFKLMKETQSNAFSWKEEFLPQQSKIAGSTLIGAFSQQSLVPALYFFHGAIPTGQLGLSIQITQAINSLSSTWSYPSGPLFGKFACLNDWNSFKKLKNLTALRCTSTAMFLIVGALLFKYGFDRYYSADRLLSWIPYTFLISTAIFNQYASTLSTAIRFTKQEPFLKLSLWIGFFMIFGTYTGSYFLGVYGIVISYWTCYFAAAIWTVLIYQRKINIYGLKS